MALKEESLSAGVGGSENITEEKNSHARGGGEKIEKTNKEERTQSEIGGEYATLTT